MAGVVPPPVHGASLSTRALFDADLTPVSKVLLEIRSSSNLESVGKASIGKGLGLIALVARCLWLKLTKGGKVLYYTPGSASFVPFVRDVLFLGFCRPFFSRTVLHYHSGGLPDYLKATPVRNLLGRWIYGRGAWAISLSRHTPVPGLEFGAEREFEVANGLDVPSPPPIERNDDEFRVLFLGNLYEDKGVFDLLKACTLAAAKFSKPIRLRFVGKWPDEKTREAFETLSSQAPANLTIDPPAAAYGEDKWKALAEANVFAFPSFYRSENFPLVLIEALAFGLPVVATHWRGIPSIIEEGVNGFMVEPHDCEALADKLVELARDP
ncbi:MAG: glycosyltransferase family 4 protein, partial [Verrucomicrobiales bacterium]